MKELDLLIEWADNVIGKYGDVSEGFDAQNPVTGKITKDEIKRFRANKPINAVAQKTSGPSDEVRAKLKSLRDEFASRAKNVSEADEPPAASPYSPLSATTREQPRPDPKAAIKKRIDDKKMKRFMGYNINEKYISRLDTNDVQSKFGALLDSRGYPNKITEQKILRYAMENAIDPNVYYHVINQKINEIYHTQISEDINSNIEEDLSYIFKQFSIFTTNNSRYQPKQKVSLIEIAAYDYGRSNRHIAITGFRKQKLIHAINDNFVQFEDGSTYPKSEIIQTKMWKQIALFDDLNTFNKCEMIMSLLTDKIRSVDGDWQFNKFEIEN